MCWLHRWNLFKWLSKGLPTTFKVRSVHRSFKVSTISFKDHSKTGYTNITELNLFRCETMGLTEIKAGTSSSDAECEKVTSVGLIVGVTIAVLVGVVAVAVAAVKLACIRKHKARRSKKRKN